MRSINSETQSQVSYTHAASIRAREEGPPLDAAGEDIISTRCRLVLADDEHSFCMPRWRRCPRKSPAGAGLQEKPRLGSLRQAVGLGAIGADPSRQQTPTLSATLTRFGQRPSTRDGSSQTEPYGLCRCVFDCAVFGLGLWVVWRVRATASNAVHLMRNNAKSPSARPPSLLAFARNP
ncbi:hypothetical protein QAD02_017350 [Eretmocerus hayati]|uniref:Uncharacterized protein n=1 Tax=Eretmocerus hayati TaxID=131215 RepID=A0ACC2PER6_9HYME|nr:hypothetical protein QAD02_017350 [Eretmocerus hayati]